MRTKKTSSGEVRQPYMKGHAGEEWTTSEIKRDKDKITIKIKKVRT